jgi:3-oxoacyl-[acyl-carrier-protein] synthase II
LALPFAVTASITRSRLKLPGFWRGGNSRKLCSLNAHSTSTPVGDLSELEAIKSTFGREGRIAVSATKSATGHLLGAAGGVEAIFTVLALRDQVAPPILNLENCDAAAEGVDLVARAARPMAMEHAISNGFGFGGVNASVILRRWR